MPGVIEIKGKLNLKKLKDTLNTIIQRHEILRTNFESIDGEIYQIVKKMDEINFDIQNFQVEDRNNIGDVLKEFIRPFDLEKDVLIRIGIGSLGREHNLMFFDIHHIVADGVTLGIFIKEFSEIYEGKALEPLKIQYKDYSAWQIKRRGNEEVMDSKRYWLKEFDEEIPVLNLPTDFNRPNIQDFKGDVLEFKLDEKKTNALKDIAMETNSTLYMVLLSILKTLLSKYSNQEDIVVGSPIAGRNHRDLENLIGMFVNTFAIKSTVDRNMSFKKYLEVIREKTLKAYENQEYQFEDLIEALNIERNLSRNPLFDVMFVLQNIDTLEINIEGLKFEQLNIENGIEKFDITMEAVERNNEILFRVSYASSLFKKETIQRMNDSYITIVNSIIHDINVKISDINIVSDIEKNKLLYEFNDSKTDYPKEKSINELFEEQVELTPDNIAVTFEDSKLTYKELNEKSNKVAACLREKGVKHGTIVGIMVNRSLEMIIGIIGILKAGGGYLPIDPETPKDRVKYMLEDSKANILLVQGNLIEEAQFNINIVNLNEKNIDKYEGVNLIRENNSSDVAYIIYTSGSTGMPKGVIINHYSAVRVVKNTNYIEISKDDRILQLSNYAFDGSIFDIYGALLNGATLVMMSKETLLDINELANLIKKKKVTITFITTALFNTIVDMKIECLANLKKILFGGERASVGHVKRALDYLGKGRIIHVYGPTESTVYATYYNVNEINKEDKTIPIGKPLANTSLLVVDDNGDIVPIGVEGELCIFGDGLSRGYLNNKELTEKKFTSSKYIKDERIYHTGDLVKWLPSGEVEFIGRMDNQVKIRGHRIELGEIESKLLEIDGIKSVVVVDKVKNDSKYICAYYVSQNEYTVSELRNILLRTLPEYMIPTYFVKLEKFILTRNGKVDKKSLPEPSGDIYTGKQYVAPRNELEKKLVQIWSEILEVKNIGIDDNFFELGGHSLKATVLVAKINKELDIAIPLREIFDRGNIRKISEFINETGENKYEKISLVEEKDYYKVSSAEKRMYLVQQFDKESIAYNAPAMMEIDGDLDCDKLKKTVTLIIERHEILRTNFRTINGEIIQIVNNMSDINLNIETIEMKDRSNLNNFINDFIKPFNLEKDLLIRVSLIKLAEKKHIMFVDMHHIVSDGSTMKIFIKEFNDIYLGKNLEPLRIQYKDYAYWQINRIESEDIKKQKNYWLSEFKGNIPVLNLPTDFSRPTMQDYKGDVIKFKLGEEETRFLKNIARKTNSTLYMVLLANINILLAKYSNQQDIVVGSPIAGRNHADLNNIMGMFVNTLAIRSTINADMTFEDYLKVVREKTLKAYENQEYQFEDLVEALNIQRDLSRNPLFDVMFVLQNVEIGEFNIDGLEFKQLFIDNDTEKFDITIQAMESCDEVEFSISYATKLFTKETIERMRDHLLTIIRAIGRNHELKIKNIDITSNLEKKFILEGYNGTDVAFTNNKTLITLFEEQVKKTPENIAVVCGENKISYRKLNEKANVLARMLIDNGIEKGEKVCILLDRSIELVVGILAILKTGSAYIPMDKSYPKNRIKAIVESCNSKVVLTDENFEKDSYGKIKMMNINDENQGNESRDNLGIITDTKDIAYVIFTSGSTGNPKGVVVTNAQCINTIIDINRKFNINDKDAILCISSICFDLSVYDIFGALISGAKVVVVRNSKDINEIIYELNSEKITVWNSVPAFMELLVDQMPTEKKNSSLRVVLLSGDWIGLELPNKIKYHFPEACTISLGGATEGAIWSIYYPINEVKKEWKSIPYGYPLANQKMFILDRNLSIQPIEIPGEICIGGAGVVEGYLNDEIKTRNSFILHPTLGKIYKTGDLGVMNKAGYIEFLGRLDYQVKIRGFRIELGEIESNLRKIEGMKTVIVVDKEGEEGKYLCAYYLGDKEYTVSELREKLLADLPEYMIPSYFIKLDKLPLTSNGKIDRKSLPEPDGKIKTGRKYVEARNDLEKRLTKIWSEVLGVNHIGIDDNFFELGGHSLKATILLGRIYKEFHVEVGLKVIFERSTIREISEYIKGKDESKIEEIPKIEKKEYYEVSSAEKRIYLVQQTNQRSVAYNLPTILEVDGDLDIDRLKKTVEQIVERHEVLRSNYLLLDGKVIKKIKKLEEVDLKIQHMNNINKENLIETFNEFIKPFDLEKDVLIRISVGKLDSLKSIIFFDMHHIVSDGSSVAVFIKEFSEIYSGKVLSPLRVQYKDYAVWQNSKKESSKLADERMYWLKEFEESIPVLNLPTDFPRPQIKDYSGNFIEFKLDKELTLALKKVLKSTNSTMYMALLASIKILLSKYSGQDEIVVGSPIAGRVHKDIENLMGVFINNIAIKSKIRGNQTFKDYLEQIKEKTLKAYENQYYQFDDLVDSLNIESSLNRNPLFDVMFMWQNMDKQEFKIEGLKFKECFVGNHSEKFDITFEAAEKDDEIIFTISYATSLFKEDTIHWMKEHLIKVIEQVSSNMVIKLSDINIGFNFSKMKDIEFEEEFTF
ncbi:amino acid adenylation domain-containing protein [Clostridium beijerinckii]|uniref:amino acid adenylation domain-containing protein n=1 Tax=Clostridium beijerinckii TaxID=1520 RepID=UPI00156FD170|nr:non-ribosomal peptide synthetase [Clostridium beijerinckii]NRV32074.1 amino acid adenylation domain-containing protein [Clostridium beijerinckii]NRX20883.1 amino acid adenylation domain-containing protein [Clostridium beijerinckii]